MKDCLSWIKAQKEYPKFLWHNERWMRAAVGMKNAFRTLPSPLPENGCVYGGMRFQPKQRGSVWKGFPPSLFWQAEREIVIRNPSRLPSRFPTVTLPQATKQYRFPSWRTWKQKVIELHSRMERSQTKKVVFGRMHMFAFSQSLPFWSLVRNVQERMAASTLFAIELSPNFGFFGASPELLFRRQQNRIISEAVAGTRPRGVTTSEDLAYEQELFLSKKDREEFGYVPEFLEKTLSNYCSSIAIAQNHIRKTHALQHLSAMILGTLHSGVQDRDLLSALHPTPALGGWPRNSALSLIAQLESFDRGWYGAPIGWATQEETEFAVAIRSCLVRDQSLYAFAAAGIVQTSCIQSEWEEIERKLKSIF